MYTRLYLNPEQKRQLAERAQLHGSTLAEEVSSALDFYLGLGVCSEDDLSDMARAASLSAERIIKKLDGTIAYLRRTQAKINRRAPSSLPRT